MNVCLQNIIQVAESIDKQACKKTYEDAYKTNGYFRLYSGGNTCEQIFDPKTLGCEKYISKSVDEIYGTTHHIDRSLMKELEKQHIIIGTTKDAKWKVKLSSEYYK